MDEPFRVLSWGCGVQSTTLGELSARGDLPRLDLIVTADTGWERRATYDARDFYITRWREMGLTVDVVQAGNIQEDATDPHKHPPFWTGGGGPLSRKCTGRLKIMPIRRHIREVLGFPPDRPPHPPPNSVELWLGISLDEWTRAREADVAYMRHRWPLLGLKWSRQDCQRWLEEHRLPVPPKSACVCCPYRQAREWIVMREEDPAEFRDACQFDEVIRNITAVAEKDGYTADKCYIYKFRRGMPVPLGEADLDADAARHQQTHGTQDTFMFCESGYCWV